MTPATKPLELRLLEYLTSRDCGMSAIAILLHTMNAYNKIEHKDYPLDADDFGRCLRVVELFPEARTNLDVMKQVSPQWLEVMNHWDELERLQKDDPSLCSRRIHELYHAIPCAHCQQPIGGGWMKAGMELFHFDCWEENKDQIRRRI